MSRLIIALLLAALVCFNTSLSMATYQGSQAYNHSSLNNASVNTATGTFRFTYPLIHAPGIHTPFELNLVYHFQSQGNFGLPRGWGLDLDHIQNGTTVINGQQWLIDPMWHDDSLFASGLKYYNQHGVKFTDEGVEREIPNAPELSYRFKSHHKDGSENYFSQQGLLIFKRDRFGNQITIEYERPTHTATKAKLMAITDNYGNRYTFVYEPGTFIVRYPDGREQRVYYDDNGVKTIANPMQLRYEFSYTNEGAYRLLKTLLTPFGLETVLGYDTIPYIGSAGESTLPVVNYFKQYEKATNKIHHEAYYQHYKSNNYTGYPLYSLSKSSDTLIDSNDENYRYTVEIKQTDGDPENPTINHHIYTYNHLHLPIEIRTLKNNAHFIKAQYNYPLTPFKYNRSTNYDKPDRITYFIWNEKKQSYIPSNRTDTRYDLFGNKTRENHWVYHRNAGDWRHIRAKEHKYFTDHFSLLAETIDRDMTSGNAIKTRYDLSPSKKTHSAKRTFASSFNNNKTYRWQPWQQIEFQYDDAGRRTLHQLTWIAKDMPGVQKTHKLTHYQLDKSSSLLTIAHEDSLGNIKQQIVDTRNGRLLTTISALGEKNEYDYNNLDQLIRHTDPEGNIYKLKHYNYAQHGLNATVKESPLGIRKRIQRDSANRVIAHEQLVDDQYQLLSAREYNAFGKLALHKDRSGEVTTYQYDDQGRVTVKTDPWLNKTHHVYDDEDLSQHIFLNGKKYQQIKKIPWLLTMQTTHYPLNDTDTAAVERRVTKNGFHKVITEESALLNTQSSQRHSVIKNTYTYDPGNNNIKTVTEGFDGTTLTKESVYDLFKNVHTFVKKQRVKTDNSRASCHQGYRYFYNSNNKLVREVSSAANDTTPLINTHRYDKNGREIEHQLANGRSIKKTYTPLGLVKSVSWVRKDQPYTVFHHHDADSRLIKLTDSNGQQQRYEYDRQGNLISLSYPDHSQQKYRYDKVNRIISKKTVSDTVLNYQYNDQDKGKLSSISNKTNQIKFIYGIDDNGIKGRMIAIERDIAGTGKTKEQYQYGAFGHLSKTVVNTNDGDPVFSGNYEFLPRGELIKQSTRVWNKFEPSATNLTHYEYDGLKRLTKETHQGGDTTKQSEIHYQYDGNNNLVKEQRFPSGESIHRHYNSMDQLTHITGTKPATLTHDANGHVVVDHQGNKYQYDDMGLLQSVTNANNTPLASFEYLPNGLLGYLHSGTDRQSFYYDLNLRTLTVFKNHKRYDFIQHDNKYLATLTEQDGEQLFLANQSTAARLALNDKGEKISTSYDYEGYGKTINSNAHQSHAGFLWNQELAEKTTGIVYLKNRFYHPDLRRFVSRDSLKVDNRYSYARANPVLFVDPMGHTPGPAFWLGSLIAVLGTFITIGSVALSATGAFTPSSLLAIASGITLATSGGMMIAEQTALDAGNINKATRLEYASYGVAGLGAILIVAAIAPSVLAVTPFESMRFVRFMRTPISEIVRNARDGTALTRAVASVTNMSQTLESNAPSFSEITPLNSSISLDETTFTLASSTEGNPLGNFSSRFSQVLSRFNLNDVSLNEASAPERPPASQIRSSITRPFSADDISVKSRIAEAIVHERPKSMPITPLTESTSSLANAANSDGASLVENLSE